VAADDRLSDFEYPFVLIDEANQSIEPESLIPLLFGCKKLILVGDQMQLGPVSKCSKTVTAGLTRSLMTRMIHLGHNPSILQHQYRMHPSISSFPRNFFYEGQLIDGITSTDRPIIPNFWLNDIPNIFLHHESNEASTGGACSVSNVNEAFIAAEVLQKIIEKGVNSDEIIVLTPYEAQKRTILEVFNRKRSNVKVYNIDEFQGNEANYIIFSTVRSNTDGDIGFLSDFRRLNVAITRAKYGMVVLGNCKTLSKTKLWSHLIKDYADKHMIFEGMFGSLRVHNIVVPDPPEYKFDEEFPYSS
jgi:regulator of nonsense transcripts 1